MSKFHIEPLVAKRHAKFAYHYYRLGLKLRSDRRERNRLASLEFRKLPWWRRLFSSPSYDSSMSVCEEVTCYNRPVASLCVELIDGYEDATGVYVDCDKWYTIQSWSRAWQNTLEEDA